MTTEPPEILADNPKAPTRVVSSDLLDRIRELIQNSMREAENFPIGGIGADGPTQPELNAAVEDGHPIEDEATFHTAQQIWLNLNKVMVELDAV